MATEFEREKQEVLGYSVMITSWYDPDQETWRASAPAYTQLSVRSVADGHACDSRAAAVQRLVSDLTEYLNGLEP
jgi:hypothetical protein